MRKLNENAIKLRSNSPSDDDFSDLYLLDALIGNASIVLLGEPNHKDGSTFLAKTRLIKFLHSEMSFDVLAFESGMYDFTKAWVHIQNGEDATLAIQQGVRSIWTSSEQMQPMINYIGEMAISDHPLEIIGFDSHFTGYASSKIRDDINTFLIDRNIAVSHTDWQNFTRILHHLTRNNYTFGK
jgi:erythromycin esterase